MSDYTVIRLEIQEMPDYVRIRWEIQEMPDTSGSAGKGTRHAQICWDPLGNVKGNSQRLLVTI